MTLLTVYKSSIPSINYAFKTGRIASFILGAYRTDRVDEIKELNDEIHFGHPHIIYAGEIDSADLDPLAQLKAKIIAEYEATRLAAIDPERDLGNYDNSKLVVSNSRDVAATSAGGSGAQLNAQLAKLKISDPVTEASPAQLAPIPASGTKK